MTSMYQAAKWESYISFIGQLLSNFYRMGVQIAWRTYLSFKIHTSHLKRIHLETPLLRDKSIKAQRTAAGAIKQHKRRQQPLIMAQQTGLHRRRYHNHINYRNQPPERKTIIRTTKDNGIQLNTFSPVGVSEQADRKWHKNSITPLVVSDVNELDLGHSCVCGCVQRTTCMQQLTITRHTIEVQHLAVLCVKKRYKWTLRIGLRLYLTLRHWLMEQTLWEMQYLSF